MDEGRFWSLIQGTSSSGSPDEQAAQVRRRLQGLTPNDLIAFKARFTDLSNAILTWKHLGAAEVIMGYASEDVFTDFRTWVIYQGRDTYAGFLDDPDSLASRGPTSDDQIGSAEVLEFLPDDLFKRATGAELYERHPETADYLHAPSGQQIDNSYRALAERFPKLTARYLPDGVPNGTPDDDGPREIQ